LDEIVSFDLHKVGKEIHRVVLESRKIVSINGHMECNENFPGFRLLGYVFFTKSPLVESSEDQEEDFGVLFRKM
jgi:hypothetical protein